MYDFKFRWLVPIIVLFILLIVIGVGIYQLNSDGNPWNFGGSTIPDDTGWDFLKKN